jgi:hypothetical protein
MFILSHAMTTVISVQQILHLDCKDGLSVALSYDCDFTEIEGMNGLSVQESTLALQALQTAPYGNVLVDLVLSHKKLLPYIFTGTRVRFETFAR